MSDRERTLQRLNKDGDSRHILLEGGGGGEVTINLKARALYSASGSWAMLRVDAE